MKWILGKIDGYKSYASGLLIAALSVAAAFGYAAPEYVFTVLAGLGIVGVKDAIRKVEQAAQANKKKK